MLRGLHPAQSTVDGRSRHEEDLGEIADRVFSRALHSPGLFPLLFHGFRLFPLSFFVAFAIAMPSLVRILMRSSSNSAKVATMLKDFFPIGSEGSLTVAQSVRFKPFRSSFPAMARIRNGAGQAVQFGSIVQAPNILTWKEGLAEISCFDHGLRKRQNDRAKQNPVAAAP